MIKMKNILQESFKVQPPITKKALTVSRSGGNLKIFDGKTSSTYQLVKSGFMDVDLTVMELSSSGGKYYLKVSAMGGMKTQRSELAPSKFVQVENGFNTGKNFTIKTKAGEIQFNKV